jgi:hypothetical protein
MLAEYPKTRKPLRSHKARSLSPHPITSPSLLPVDLITDMNNDGKINSLDRQLRDTSLKDNASDEDVEKGREYLFTNDKLSNGLGDTEDPAAPTGTVDDDDIQEVEITLGVNVGIVSFDHPEIGKLKFYENKSCSKEMIFPHDLATKGLPKTLYIRTHGNFSDQKDGILTLKYKVAAGKPEVVTSKLRLTIVNQMGDPGYFTAARDYIQEQNTSIYRDKKQYKDSAANRVYIAVMRQEAVTFSALDAFRMGKGDSIAGISEVAKAFPTQNVIINGNMTFDRVVRTGGGRIDEITKQCHGRLISKGLLMAGSSDNPNPNIPSQLFGEHPLRGSALAGNTAKYIAMRKKGEIIFRRGRVPADLATKKAKFGITEAMGGFSTQYDTIRNEAGFFGVAEIATKERMIFTVIDATPGKGHDLGPRIRDDVKRGGVQALNGGQAHELELLKTDGGSSLCLAVSNSAGKLDIPVIGSKHTGRFFKNYVIHTYLMFKADKPRP